MKNSKETKLTQVETTVKTKKFKVALIYDRVNKWGGAERVLLALHELYPDAPLYTSVYDKNKAPWAKVFPEVRTSFLQNIPFAKSNHEFFAVLMPLAFESFDFTGFDVLISVTSEAAKGIRVKPGTMHICYCLTPTRYLWSGYDLYFKNKVLGVMAKLPVYYLRKWDLQASKRPDLMIAISTVVGTRIRKYYGRSPEIIFPPVDMPVLNNKKTNSKKYYLLVSRLDYGYKKVDLVIDVFNKLDKKLIIVGTGREINKLKKKARKNIVFTGQVSETQLIDYYRGAKALLMPQEEDFGIVALEAQSQGIPVIAFNKGGSLDTVILGKSGIFFSKQSSAALIESIKKFENLRFNIDYLIENANRFSKEKFKVNFARIVERSQDGR